MSYFDRLRALSAERNTLLCVGLDPDPERIEGGAAGALRHCREVVRNLRSLPFFKGHSIPGIRGDRGGGEGSRGQLPADRV